MKMFSIPEPFLQPHFKDSLVAYRAKMIIIVSVSKYIWT